MRVGVVTPRQPPTVGGGFTFHESVLRALNSATTHHEFVLLDLGGAAHVDWAGSGLPLIDVQTMFPSRTPSLHSASATEPAARKLALDVVWYLDPLAEVLSVPVFATVLDLAHRQLPFFPEVSRTGWDWESRENHYRRVLPRAARIFIGTHVGKWQIVRCYGVDPANIVVNPFPTPVFARGAEPLDDGEVLGRHALTPGFLFYPAQFWSHKNHVNLLLALKQLETEHGLTPDLVLTGADKGNLAHVLQVTSELGLQQRVHYLGFVSNSDLAALYRCAAALVFPSFVGPDNLPPLEAFSLGCPVLASRIEGAEEQLGSVAAGFFDPTRPEDIAAVIARVLGNSNYRTGLIINGRELAARRTPEAYVKVVLHTLDEFEPWRRNWPTETFQLPVAVSCFPDDLANAALLHSGISKDAWLAGCSSLLLSAPLETSLLTMRGEVPYFAGDDFSTVLSVTLDGIVLAQPKLGTGKFEVAVGSPGRRGLHRIELAFSALQQLPDPDLRMVGAKLDFIGFSDENMSPMPPSITS